MSTLAPPLPAEPAEHGATASSWSSLAPVVGYRSDVQVLRGAAVLAVVAYHAGVLPGGFVGVDVFFVISGFVIGRVLADRMGGRGSLRFGEFYGRRARRLLPALALLLGVVVVASPLLAPLGGAQAATPTGVAAALFSANAYLYRATDIGYFASSAELNPLLHTWSLSLEEQFYFVVPALVLLAWRAGARRRASVGWTRAAVGVLFAVSLATCLRLTTGDVTADDLRLSFFAPWTRAWEFAAGLALVLLPARWCCTAGWRRVVVTSGAVAMVAACVGYSSSTRFPGVAALVPVLGAAAVLYGGTSRDPGAPAGWSAPWLGPLRGLGDLSYSWYLWHWPLIVFAAAFWPGAGRLPLLIAAAVSLWPAWCSMRWIEGRFRWTSSRPPGSQLRLVLCCIALPLAAVPVSGVVADRVDALPDVAGLQAAHQPHRPALEGCPVGGVALSGGASGDGGPCTWGAVDGATSVVLLGDSNADQLSEALIDATGSDARDDTRLDVATSVGCPISDVVVLAAWSGTDGAICSEFRSRMLDHLERRPPDVVVVANGTDKYVRSDGVELEDPRTGRRATSAEDKAEMFQAGLERSLSRLARSGATVVLVEVLPKPWAVGARFTTAECSAALLIVDPGRCAVAPFAADNEVTRSANELERRAAAAAGVATWELASSLCPDGRCAAEPDGRITWAEPQHISPGASSTLAPAVAERFARLPTA